MTVDDIDRRRRASRGECTAWHYDYNSRSEVVGAWKSRDGANPVRLPGMDRAYDYDNIGNRLSAKEGGNGGGAARRTYSYAANELNLYTTVTRGAESGGKTRGVDFTGTAADTQAMTVNGVASQRSGPWWRAEVEPTTAADLYVAGNVKANGTSLAAEPRKVPSPPATLSLTAPAPNPIQYDADGNLLCDGWRRYTWDAEQRLVKVVTLFPEPHKTTTTFAYDAFGRRIAKTVTQKEVQGSVEVDVIREDLRFLYQGWNLAAVYKVATTWSGSAWITDTTLAQSYVWGIDIGSTGLDASRAGHLTSPFSRAGGVGGLVLARFHQEPTTEQEHFPCYDGYGNVLALIAAKHEGGTTATYDYDPFGNTVSATGPLAQKNPFRFSTKYTDGETGLVYYGYRYLDTLWGRWINRDPIEEDGGLNLVGMVKNHAVGLIDSLWLDFIAVGASDAMGKILPAGHFMLTYWVDTLKCIEVNDFRRSNANESNGKRFRKSRFRGFVPRGIGYSLVSSDAKIKRPAPDLHAIVQVGFDVWLVNQGIPPFTFNHELVHVSQINYSDDDGDATEYVVVFAEIKGGPEKVAEAKWRSIMTAARNYKYAEHRPNNDNGEFPVGQVATNWPNSYYGHLALDGNYNNSNTFVHEMLKVIGVKVPTGIWSRWHAGNWGAEPVKNGGIHLPTPTFQGKKK